MSGSCRINLDIEHLPPACDVLIIGAGPAGSAAAITLARAGIDVVLVDQHSFPRDKVCGDGLIPDALRALGRLGVYDQVMAQALAINQLSCVGPRGGQVDVPSKLAVLPRKHLDNIVCRAAVGDGARMFAPARFVATIEEGGTVVGAQLVGSSSGQNRSIASLRARWTLLATGAMPQALMAAKMCKRSTPSGVALRGYIKSDALARDRKAMEIVWHQSLTPGYGWIFPCPDGVFNIGVGVADNFEEIKDGFTSRGRYNSLLGRRQFNLRNLMSEFRNAHAPARELLDRGMLLGPMKGAPLRCTLEGARVSRPGLMVLGEAVGSTYSFSGEGIGKALETGIGAAEAILAAGKEPDADLVARADYEARICALKPRFELYKRANLVNRFPSLADLVIWRAKRSPRVLQRMIGVLDETSNPGNLLSFKGLVRLFRE